MAGRTCATGQNRYKRACQRQVDGGVQWRARATVGVHGNATNAAGVTAFLHNQPTRVALASVAMSVALPIATPIALPIATPVAVHPSD